MVRANWDDFNRKNRDKTKAFEDMCRVLFLRKYKLSSYDYDYNYNQAGLEFEPIYDAENKKWCGAQCKYFSEEANSTKYAQIYKSLKKAYKFYKGKLDVVIIYTNAQLKHICTEEELLSDMKSYRVEIERESRKNNVKLLWMQADNLADTLNESGNRDLVNLYFSDSREQEFYNKDITIDEKTFLNSNEFIDLGIKEHAKISNLRNDILNNKINLLLGVAGTGKTLAMKKIYMDFSDDFYKKYHDKETKDQEVCLPVLIKLRECVNGNLESLVRERLKDYGLNFTENVYKYVYLFDGLDEVSYLNLDKIIQFIERVSRKTEIKAIVISSRIDSNNLSYLYQKIECQTYEIDKLHEEDIKDYFKRRNDKKKIEYWEKLDNKDLLDELDDIFSVSLLWDNIERIDKDTSKIQIIELSINHWIQHYAKYTQLQILEPKQKNLISICKQIAFEMQKKMSLSLGLDEIQKIVCETCKLYGAKAINNVVYALTDLFFEKNSSKEEATLSFRHRRFQEYFLYLVVDEKFYKNPNILRELKLLPNKDFVIKIFLKTSIKEAEDNSDLQKVFPLRLLEAYLGDDYLRGYNDKVIGRNNHFGISEATYTFSHSFLYLLSTYLPKDLEILLDNKNLCIYDAINNDNFAEFIEIYHRANEIDIREIIMEKCLIEGKNIKIKKYKSYFYFLHKICGQTMQEIYDSHIKGKYENSISIKHTDYISSGNEVINDFIDLALEFDIEFLTEILASSSKDMLEIICYNLLKYNNINTLFSCEQKYSNFRNNLLVKMEKVDEEYCVHTLVILEMLSKKETYNNQIEKVFDEVNQSNYPTWSQNIELHIAMAILLDKKQKCVLKEFQLGIALVKGVYENYDNQKAIIDCWLNAIRPFNFIYDDWLKYSHSIILGTLISRIDFEPEMIKRFLRQLCKYQSVIWLQSVLFTIFKENRKLFDVIINQEFLERIMKDSLKEVEEYASYSESIFQFAAMYSSLDVGRKYYLLVSGVENGMVRPAYHNEELASIMAPGCLYFAHQNYWLDEFELEESCKRLYNILQVLNNTTDGAGDYGCLKWLIEECLSNDILQDKLYDVREISIYENDSVLDYDMSLVNMDNLEQYYNCRVENAPYNSLNFWTKLIEMEFLQDSSLKILYKVFEDNLFPSVYGFPIIDYIHFPIAVLMKNEKTRETILNYLIEKSGRYSLYNMIRVDSILGNTKEGMQLLDFLFSFLDALVAREHLNIKFNSSELLSMTQKYMNICNSSIDEWYVDENKCEMHMKNSPDIRIIWDGREEKEEFHEKWATNFTNNSAYLYNYTLYDGNSIMKQFSLVKVDGYRAVLPIPLMNTMLVKRDEYFLSRLFNYNLKEMNSYMQRAGLQVQ